MAGEFAGEASEDKIIIAVFEKVREVMEDEENNEKYIKYGVNTSVRYNDSFNAPMLLFYIFIYNTVGT